MPTVGDVLLHYRFLEVLGEGGTGVVWRALDTRLNREVAVKLLPERIADSKDAMARLEQEARVLAALNHPNIVSVYSVEEAEGRRFLVMELIRGKPLDASIPPSGLPLDRLLDLAIPLAEGLAAAHGRGVVHRDLKPGNVLVGEDGRPRILDFGLASGSVPDPSLGPSGITTLSFAESDRLVGTIPYMSPEQVQCHPIDHRADVFSFGVMLYEMATGIRPFHGDTAAQLIASILRDEPAPPSTLRPDLPRDLDRIVERSIDKDPGYRFQSTLDLRNEIEALRRHREVPIPETAGPSVAVLPFVDMSREKDQEYFCDGMAEEIISALARVSGIDVASRTSSFRFRGSSLDSQEIARRLRVRALLEGSVRKAGDRLRVTAQLVNAADGFELWSETFDRKIEDIFAIQEGIARSIADALEVTLSGPEHEALGKAPTRDVRAYDYCLRGRSFYFQYRRRGVEIALEMFRRAIEIDSSYARAWAGVADCYCFFFLYVSRVGENIQRAQEASRRALDLDPDLAEAQASWGVAMSIAGRDEEAVASFEQALRLDPKLFEARYFYARHCFSRGDLEQAARFYEEAEALRPEDYQSPLLVAQIYGDLGRSRQADAAYRRGLRKAEARLRLQPDDSRARYMGANALVAIGLKEQGLAWARIAIAQDPDEPMLLYNVGCIYSMAGEGEEAIEALERSVDRGLTQRGWFQHDSNLDPVREHPRFRKLLERL